MLGGECVTKTVTLLGESRAAVFKVMMAYTNHGKTSSANRNSGQKPKISERDRCALQRIVSNNHRTNAARMTAELIIHLADHFHKISPMRSSQIHHPGTAAIVKPLITEKNTKKQKIWWDDHKSWTFDDQKYVIWSDESYFTLFPTSGWVYVRRTSKEAYNPECQVRTVKRGGTPVMI